MGVRELNMRLRGQRVERKGAKMLIWTVCEDGMVWAAFTHRKDAYAFRAREFAGGVLPKIRSMRVYKSLEDAPTTDPDGNLEEVLRAN